MVKKLLKTLVIAALAVLAAGSTSLAASKAQHPVGAADAELQNEVHDRLVRSCTGCVETWKKLVETGYLDTTEQEQIVNRRQYAAIQLALEQTITALLKNQKLDDSVEVIHTLHIPTPLRIGGGDIPPGVIIAPALSDDQYINSVRQRYLAIIDYLDAGGRLLTLHQKYKKPEKIAGYEVYDMTRNKYPNLRDHEMKDFPIDYSGATYVMRTLAGKMYMFSVMAPQANSSIQAKWAMWYGQIDGDMPKYEVISRFLKIDSFLVNNDIDLYETLGVK
ncbi:MAG: hypothetical protein JSS50_00920 [Proteobacteria bacterium]|nr:hypothetical protein [Pseudomonadota bacterium]